MPLYLQLAAVAIISAFVVYEGWCSAALSVFSCQYIDSGTVEDTLPPYYANFQAVSKVGLEKACGRLGRKEGQKEHIKQPYSTRRPPTPTATGDLT
jgi:hypothetical protein